MEQLTSKTNKEFSRKKYYLIYSGIFLFCSTLFILYLVLNGKTNINFKSDGMNQHYRVLIYYSRYIRGILKNLIVNHIFSIPLWDFSIGEGADILQTFHTHVIGDPFSLIAVFFPEKQMHVAYIFIELLKMYLAGIFYSELCIYLNIKSSDGILAGALSYSFCFWAIKNLTLHFFFFVPFMYLPLLILGIEKVLKENKTNLFTITVFLCAVSNLYFFYMEALAAGLYGLLRVISMYRTDIRKIVFELLKMLICAIIGVLMAAVVLCPMIYAYLSDSRLYNNNSINMFYPWFFYERLFTVFVSNDSPYDLCMGFVSPTILSLFILLKDFKKHTLLLIIDILCAIFVLFPVFGSIWNGFSYVIQRWSFVIALPIAYGLTITWDEFKNNRSFLYISLPIIFCVAFFSAWARNERVIVPVVICFLFCFISTIDYIEKKLYVRLKKVFLFSLVILNIVYIFEYNLSPRGGDVLSDLLTIEEAKNFTSTSEAYTITKLSKEDDFFRYSGNFLTNNASILYDVHSTNFYWSITNPSDQVFRKKTGLRDRLSWQLKGYDGRAELETLSNVKYFVMNHEYVGSVPFGFVFLKEVDGYEIYKNKYPLPFGYTYNNAISYDVFDKLNMIERQEVIMQSIVVDNPLLASKYDKDGESVDYQIVCEEGISYENNSFNVKNNKSTIKIKYAKENNCESYLIIEGLKYTDTEGLVEDDETVIWITMSSSNDAESYIVYLTDEHRYNFDKTDFVNYLGYDENESGEITISFSMNGRYTYDSLSVITKEMKEYEEYVKNLTNNHLENVSFDINRISGNINVSDNKYLLLSIPYSKGWNVKVDGDDVDLLRANVHHMAIYLEPGKHAIELTYKTPWLNIGFIISLLGFIVFVAQNILSNNKKESTK